MILVANKNVCGLLPLQTLLLKAMEALQVGLYFSLPCRSSTGSIIHFFLGIYNKKVREEIIEHTVANSQ